MKMLLKAAGVLALLVLCACSTTTGTMEKPKQPDIMQMPDGKIAAAGTIGNSIDASATVVAIYQPTAHGLIQVDGDAAIGPTVPGQMAIGITSGMGAAAVQGLSGIAMTAMKGNCGDNCGGDQYLIQGGTAIAANEANANANADVRVRQQAACPTCNIVKKH